MSGMKDVISSTVATGSSCSQPENQDAPIKLNKQTNKQTNILFGLLDKFSGFFAIFRSSISLLVAASGEHGNKFSTYCVPGLPCGSLSDLAKATEPISGSSL